VQSNVDIILAQLKNTQVEGNNYTGISLTKNTYIAMDHNGLISLIVKTKDKSNSSISTDHLILNIGVSCTINSSNNEYSGKCHILSCKSNDAYLINSFVLLSIALGNEITEYKNTNILYDFFNSLVQLFKMTQASNLETQQQGLWAELFLMKHLNVVKFCTFWHSEPGRKYDFSTESTKLEVKSTTKYERIHSFSHMQLYRSDNIPVVIASIQLQKDDAGLSLKDLIDLIKKELEGNTELLIKLEKAVAKAGMNNERIDGPSFDESFAQSSLAWFNAAKVPRYNQGEPKGVSNTRYNIDLSNTEETSTEEFNNWFKMWN
jgi:hypothetical protein